MSVVQAFTLQRGVKAFVGVVLLQTLLLAGPAWGGGDALTLGRDNGQVALTAALEFWVDAGAKTSVEKIEADAERLRFDATVQNPRAHWQLELPMSGVDKIALYYRGQSGPLGGAASRRQPAHQRMAPACPLSNFFPEP